MNRWARRDTAVLGWLAFHRDALHAKCAGLTRDQLALRPAPPSRLSLLGLVRHMAEMERSYGSWPFGEEAEFTRVWGTYADGAEDDFDCGPEDALTEAPGSDASPGLGRIFMPWR